MCRAALGGEPVLQRDQALAAGAVGHRARAAANEVDGQIGTSQTLPDLLRTEVFIVERQPLVGQHAVAMADQLGQDPLARRLAVVAGLGQVDGQAPRTAGGCVGRSGQRWCRRGRWHGRQGVELAQ